MSTYPVLDNKPIDQWKVTELKEELKRRRLPVRGLKDDLIRRLDEALRAESETANESSDNGTDDKIAAVDESEKTMDGMDETCNRNEETGDACDAAGETKDTVMESDSKNEETGNIIVESGNSKTELGDSVKVHDVKDDREHVLEEEPVGGVDYTAVDVGSKTIVETTIVETGVTVTESMVTETTEIDLSGEDMKNNETQNKEESNSELKIEESKSLQEEAKPESSDVNIQVYEVSNVKSDSICTDTTVTTTVTINEKNEQLKDDVIANDVKLELDVKPSLSDNIVVDGGKLLAMDVDEPPQDEEKNNKVTNGEGIDGNYADMGKKNECGELGSAEKFNLEKSSGEDSLEEDRMETSKETDLKVNSSDEKVEVNAVKAETTVCDTVGDLDADKKTLNSENKNGPVVPDVKRKFGGGQESGASSESIKRQRKWNSEGLNVVESRGQGIDLLSPSLTTTPKDVSTTSAAMARHNFSRSDSMAAEEPPKERVVPPSSAPSTNSLRIDRFLRPFTLKAVQELLGKTGSVTSFWMDHIKTHCYVTYSSVEEAIETRNAVYNLQWPPNGGRLLVAEFVDPQEVKTRLEAPLPSPTTLNTTVPLPSPAAAKPSPTPSPRLPVQKQQLPPPPSLPPPPPLSNPPLIRERPLPPPPPLPERVEPPIVTLDDLFRKTKATPRIYYLPLSDEQVAEKAKVVKS